MKDRIAAECRKAADAFAALESIADSIEAASDVCVEALRKGNTIFLCGNGGSAADAQHIAAELVGRFLRERKAMSAVALTVDTSILTAVGNDYGYDEVFSRQVEGLAVPGDVLICYSTSGNSKNVLRAIEKAHSLGAKAIGLTGLGGGKMAGACDVLIAAPSEDTPRIQELHGAIGHILCGVIEETLCA